ncbi:MAG: aspartyl/glutamyl-tRNA amidotransferase subunit C [Deltaproteobacteria bacterium]|nr:aspartyl/glutamyl-tRNA amidotransferase subunit C [Deltaproteobacteria bacterium]
MKIDEREARRIARLACLELLRVETRPGAFEEPAAPLFSADQLSALAHDLEAVLGYVERIAELDLADVPPTSHGVSLPTSLRADASAASLEAAAVLRAAALHDEDSFLVQKILDG